MMIMLNKSKINRRNENQRLIARTPGRISVLRNNGTGRDRERERENRPQGVITIEAHNRMGQEKKKEKKKRMETSGYAGGQPWTVAWCRAKRIQDNKQKTRRRRRKKKKLFFPLTKVVLILPLRQTEKKPASGGRSARKRYGTNQTRKRTRSRISSLTGWARWALLTALRYYHRFVQFSLHGTRWGILHPVEE